MFDSLKSYMQLADAWCRVEWALAVAFFEEHKFESVVAGVVTILLLQQLRLILKGLKLRSLRNKFEQLEHDNACLTAANNQYRLQLARFNDEPGDDPSEPVLKNSTPDRSMSLQELLVVAQAINAPVVKALQDAFNAALKCMRDSYELGTSNTEVLLNNVVNQAQTSAGQVARMAAECSQRVDQATDRAVAKLNETHLASMSALQLMVERLVPENSVANSFDKLTNALQASQETQATMHDQAVAALRLNTAEALTAMNKHAEIVAATIAEDEDDDAQ